MLLYHSISKLKESIIDNYVYVTTIIISALIMLIALLLSNSCPFGENFPLLGNGYVQDYAQFCNAVRQIKAGHFYDFLDYGIGLTFDNYGIKSYAMTFIMLRPWLYLIYYFMPEGWSVPVFFSYYFMNYIIAGPLFIYYLTHRKSGKAIDKKNWILIVMGLCYGLSAYNLSFFMYFFRYMIFIPVIFLGVEKLVYDKKPYLYIFSLAYLMATEAYYAFIMCIFIVLYYLTLEHGGVKQFLSNSVRFAISSIVSAGLSAAFLVPYFIRTRYSPYGSFDNESPSIINWFGSILNPLADYSVGRDGMTTSPIEYRANIYCGMLVLLVFPIYMFIKDISLNRRIKMLIFLLIIYLGFDNQLFNYIFHGFHYQWQVPNRFSAFFIFILMVMFYDIVIHLSDIKAKYIITSMVIMSGVIFITYFYTSRSDGIADHSISKYILSFVFVAIYLICGIIYSLGVKGWLLKINKYIPRVAAVTLSLEVLLGAVLTLRTTVSFPESVTESSKVDKVNALVERHQDMQIPYVITEYPGDNLNKNIAYMTGTHSLSFYTSSSYSQHFDLLYRWGVLFSKNITYYTNGSPLSDMMLHVRYHVVNNEDFRSISPYTLVDMEENIALYENPYYLPLGVVYDASALSSWNQKSGSYMNYGSSFERDNDFANSFGTGDIYEEISIEPAEEEMSLDNNYYEYEEYEDGSVLYTFYINSTTGGKLYMQIAQALEYIGTATAGADEILYYYVPSTLNLKNYDDIKLAIWNEDNFSKLYDTLSSNVMIGTEYTGSSIKGLVSASDEEMLYMAMPAMPGFTLYIDGNETEYEDYMDGIGVRLMPGYHVIELDFSPVGMVMGWQLSVITILLILVYNLLLLKKGRLEVPSKQKLIRMAVHIVYLIVLLPMFYVFDGSGNMAVQNGWFICLVAYIMFIYAFKNKKEIDLRSKNSRLSLLFTALFLMMLPVSDILSSTTIINGKWIYMVWKWFFYLPVFLISLWIIVSRLIEKMQCGINIGVIPGFLSKRNCFIIIIITSVMFLFSAIPGIWIYDDVARVALQVSSGEFSNWDSLGYVFYVYITSIGGRFLYGACLVQSVLWVLINRYILDILNEWSPQAMRIYTVISVFSVTPYFYLDVMYKDTIFAMGVLALSAGIFGVVLHKRITRMDFMILALVSLPATLCRHGGYVTTVSGLALLIIYLIKHHRNEIKKCLMIPLIHFATYILIYTVLFNAFNVTKVPAYVKYGTPLSIIASAAEKEVEFEEEDRIQLEKVMPVSDWGLCYDKYWADAVSRPWGGIGTDNLYKMNELIETEGYGKFIIKLNMKLLIHHPVIWFDAFMGMGNEIWEISRPWDMTEYYMPVGALCDSPYNEEIDYSLIYWITHPVTCIYNEVPVLHSAFLRGGLSLFIMILSIVIMLIKHYHRFIIPCIPVIVYSCVMMLAIPAPDARYILPVLEVTIFIIPILLSKGQSDG